MILYPPVSDFGGENLLRDLTSIMDLKGVVDLKKFFFRFLLVKMEG